MIDDDWHWICTSTDTVSFEVEGLTISVYEFVTFLRHEWRHWYYSKVWRVPFVWRKGKE